jgi:hypothetical protein
MNNSEAQCGGDTSTQHSFGSVLKDNDFRHKVRHASAVVTPQAAE